MKNRKPIRCFILTAGVLVAVFGGCFNPVSFEAAREDTQVLTSNPVPAGTVPEDPYPFPTVIMIRHTSADPAADPETNRAVIGPSLADIANNSNKLWNFVQVIALQEDTIVDFDEWKRGDLDGLSLSLDTGDYNFLTLVGHKAETSLPTLLAANYKTVSINSTTTLPFEAYAIAVDTKFTTTVPSDTTLLGGEEAVTFGEPLKLLPVPWQATWELKGSGAAYLNHNEKGVITTMVGMIMDPESTINSVEMEKVGDFTIGSVTLDMDEFTAGRIDLIGKKHSVAFNLEYIPVSDLMQWRAYSSEFTNKKTIDSIDCPVWIIRNGLNDAEQDTNTNFTGSSGNTNGAIPYKVWAVDPDDETTWPNDIESKEELAEAGYTLATLSEGKYVKASQGGAYISFTSDKDISGAELYYVLTSDKVTEVEGYSSYTKLTLGENTLATVAVGNSPYTYSNIFIPNFDSTSGRRKVFLKLIKEGKVSNTLSITGKATITIDPDTGTGISANS